MGIAIVFCGLVAETSWKAVYIGSINAQAVASGCEGLCRMVPQLIIILELEIRTVSEDRLRFCTFDVYSSGINSSMRPGMPPTANTC